MSTSPPTEQERAHLLKTRELFQLALDLNPRDPQSKKIIEEIDLRLSQGSTTPPSEEITREHSALQRGSPIHLNFRVKVEGPFADSDLDEVVRILEKRRRIGEERISCQRCGGEISFRISPRYPSDPGMYEAPFLMGQIIGVLEARNIHVVGHRVD